MSCCVSKSFTLYFILVIVVRLKNMDRLVVLFHPRDRRVWIFALAGLFTLPAFSALAAPASYESAFQATFRDPGSLDKAFAFVKEATAAGDREGAIAALERMLILSPDQPHVRLQLARLYGELKSYEQAKSYAQSVLTSNAAEDVKQEARAFLASTSAREPGHTLSGSLGSSLGYQSNANSATKASAVDTSAGSVDVPSTSRGRADLVSVSSLLLVHNWRPEGAESWTWQTALGVLASEQARVSGSTFRYADVTSGPRIDLSDRAGVPATLWIYAATTQMLLSSHPYLSAAGGGGVLTVNPVRGTIVEFAGDARQTTYHDSSIATTAQARTGDTATFRGGLKQRAFGEIDVLAGAFISRIGARQPEFAHSDVGGFAGLTFPFAGLPGLASSPWRVTATVSRTIAAYHAPDATVDPLIKRLDRVWTLNSALNVPLTDKLAGFVNVSRVSNTSNVNLYRYQATTASAGAVLSF